MQRHTQSYWNPFRVEQRVVQGLESMQNDLGRRRHIETKCVTCRRHHAIDWRELPEAYRRR